jgi:beta-mannosidase
MAACTSSVDYYGQAKPLYYAIAHAYEPIHVSAKFQTIAWGGREVFEAEIWVTTSLNTPMINVKIIAQLVGLSGTIYHEQIEPMNCSANSTTRLTSVKWPFDTLNEKVFFLDLRLEDQVGEMLSRNRYLFTYAPNLAPMLALPQTQLNIEQNESGDEWQMTISNRGTQTAVGLWFQDERSIAAKGYAYFDDNHFCLFPNETRTLICRWQDVPKQERHLSLSSWNTQEWKR